MGIKLLALKHKGVIGGSIRESLTWAEEHIKRYNRYDGKHNPLKNNKLDTRFIIQEFIFRGFIPIDDFQRKEKRFYIKSNVGRLIYPVHIKNGLGHQKPQSLFRQIGLTGYTQFDQSYFEKWHDRISEEFSKKHRYGY